MTHTIDNFLVSLAFDRAELEEVHTRKYWYMAICVCACLALCTTGFAAQAWMT